jgi:mannose-6-phosphate isomerase-like protein (cupin superfamily)
MRISRGGLTGTWFATVLGWRLSKEFGVGGDHLRVDGHSALCPVRGRRNNVRHSCNPYEGGVVMKGFVKDIEGIAVKNVDFRQVLYTAKHCQLVVMALKPKEEIGAEVHKLDQFFRVEKGTGEAVLDGVRTAIRAGFAVVVPAGTNHNIINTGDVALKLYTLYAPPNHRDGVVHHTRHDAEADNEHFDGKTTE